MEMVKHAVTWVEIPVKDFERARQFYQTIFDFRMPEMDMGRSRVGVLLYDQPGGGVGGAIVQGESYRPTAAGTLVYLNGGTDLNAVLSRVPRAGGSIEVPKTRISPDIGFFAIFKDCEGNRVGLHSRG